MHVLDVVSNNYMYWPLELGPMASRHAMRAQSSLRVTPNESLYLGAPKNFKTLPTWEKILILASTYKPGNSSPREEAAAGGMQV